MRLLHLGVVNAANQPDTYWNGQQLVAIYGKKTAGHDGGTAKPPRQSNDSLVFDLRGMKPAIIPNYLSGLAALSNTKRQSARHEIELRAAVEERDAALAAARQEAEQGAVRAVETAAHVVSAHTEIDRQRKRLVELGQERDAAQLLAAERVHGELLRLRDALAATHREIHDRDAELARVRQDAADIRKVHASAEGQVRAREIELEESRRQLTQARDAVAAAERRRSDLESAVAELRAASGRRTLWGLVRRVRRRQVEVAVNRGDHAIYRRDWAEAARHYRIALRGAPELMAIWVQLGHALKEQGDYRGAEEAYRRAAALDGSVADTPLQLGHLFKLQSRWEEAADAYDRALQINPDVADAASELARLGQHLIDEADKARDARNWTLAARLYRRALLRQPGLAAIWVQLGHALKEQGALAEAESAYRRALDLDNGVADTHLQLGHLLKLQARRSQATRAYATAIRLDPDLAAARESLHALLGYSPSEAERALLANGAADAEMPLESSGSGIAAAVVPLGADDRDGADLAKRYGVLFPDATCKIGGGHDVIWLGVIDWHFRIQRPQHLAAHLADTGHRIFYISLVFEPADSLGRFRIIESPHLGVFDIRLRLETESAASIYQGLSPAAVSELQMALDEMVTMLGIRTPIVVVEYPTWHDVAYGIAGATVVNDCLDLATGFSNAAASLGKAEAEMFANADLVVAASQPLVEHIARQRPSVLIRNAAEVGFFGQAFTDRATGPRPVIGYIGAIAEWFEIAWIEECAAAHRDWEFRLIGRTDGCDISRAQKLPNVQFLGEKPYQELPLLLREFDVAIIPFKLIDLTRCTNPVKLYEYMAAGKAVVSAAMPEVIDATEMVYIARDAQSFGEQIAQALAEDTEALREQRRAWAREHDWANRARQLTQAVDETFPLVSVIVLTYNNWEYTSACLFSLRNWSEYPNLEIIVVDNASTDGTREKLRALEHQNLRIILNDSNLGFPAGNNVGMRAARGEYVILLNNDTFVTRGWVRDLIRPMQRDPRVGLVGPLTNKIGNEQKIKIAYRSMQEMQRASRRFVRGRLRHIQETRNLAFFCVAIRRSVLDEVGLLDEAYGLGFFEDDDYCRRVEAANYKMIIVDDVFVHHHLSVSFDTIGTKAAEQMAHNRVIFEERWGPWQPHHYRDEPGFG
ncbi:MAG TPA: glycosyltransferase [Stellaceae bacterium]|nr:glycosyltransferase [Stellaceae bacterium]